MKEESYTAIPLWAVRPVQSLSACTRVHFTLTQCLYKGAVYLTFCPESHMKYTNILFGGGVFPTFPKRGGTLCNYSSLSDSSDIGWCFPKLAQLRLHFVHVWLMYLWSMLAFFAE
jgi:hypothetical protein